MKRGYKTKLFQKSKEQPRLSFAVTGIIWTWEPWPWLAEAVCSLGLLRPANGSQAIRRHSTDRESGDSAEGKLRHS